jgi:hypothetical protein
MEREDTALQAQLDQFRAYFRDHDGELELLAESADELLRMMAAYVLVDLTLERHVLLLSDRQLQDLMSYAPAEEMAARRQLQRTELEGTGYV